ncbi:hypothetical protein GFL39_26400 [Rhizobium leguminosarum bv. viciae]|uniref:hypothetical protein n=1 Tax=Rhizobium leguminosarum TaxID=384 RepID=UPI0014423F9D|nr:hypothetical protein [Rhizobium leguminosarum]NKL08404.1 hypothetical protein [Rhizobium leguminosarum bv. viciae]
MLRLPLTLPVHERTRLRSPRRVAPVVQEPEIPATGSALLLSDGATFALTDAPAYDLGIHYATDRALNDLPIRIETTSGDRLLVITSAGPSLVTLGELLDILET